jgi:hypothetical protein
MRLRPRRQLQPCTASPKWRASYDYSSTEDPMTGERGSVIEPIAKPAFWYGIPHGYHALNTDPSVAHLEAMLEQVRALPVQLRNDAERVLRFYASFVISLKRQNVHDCLMGMHPDEEGDFPLSVLVVSTTPTGGADAELAVASLATRGPAEDSPGRIVPLDLPCGTGFLVEQKVTAVAPGRTPAVSDGPLEADVWRGTVAMAEADRSSVILLQMVTPAVARAADYRDILIGVAHTVTFTDPNAEKLGSDSVEAAQGGAVDTIRKDFG